MAPHWLIVGDSHAGALTRAFSLWLAERGEAGQLVYRSGCAPVLESGDAVCRHFMQSVLEKARADRQIGNVMLVSIWREPLEPGYTDDRGQYVTGQQAVLAFGRQLHATLAALRNTGIAIYVWRPLPAMPADVPPTMARRLMYGIDRPVQISLRDHRSTFGFLDSALTRDRALLAGTIDPAPALCPNGICRGDIGGRPLFIDNNHPALSQTPRLANVLRQQMRTVPRAGTRPD